LDAFRGVGWFNAMMKSTMCRSNTESGIVPFVSWAKFPFSARGAAGRELLQWLTELTCGGAAAPAACVGAEGDVINSISFPRRLHAVALPPSPFVLFDFIRFHLCFFCIAPEGLVLLLDAMRLRVGATDAGAGAAATLFCKPFRIPTERAGDACLAGSKARYKASLSRETGKEMAV
jgi:hypothetical protein